MHPLTSPANAGDSPVPDVVVLDACVLLNLYASRRVEEILASLPFRCVVAAQVQRETLWYLAPAEGNQRLERRSITLDSLVETQRVGVIDLTSAEESAFVELAQHLGDGEAASGALAIGRAAPVATDDFKAIQLFRRLNPPLRTIGTATLLRCWEERSQLTRSDVANTLHAIRRGARFSPRPDADDATWWYERLREISHH